MLVELRTDVENLEPKCGLVLTSLNSRAAVVLDEPRTEVEVLDPENGLMLTAVPPAKHSQSPQWCEM